MSLRTWLAGLRLARVDSKLKRLHVQQRHVRDKLSKLEDRHKKGMPPAEYEREKSRLEAEKTSLTEKLHALVAEEHELKAAVKADDGASRS